MAGLLRYDIHPDSRDRCYLQCMTGGQYLERADVVLILERVLSLDLTDVPAYALLMNDIRATIEEK